MAEFEPYYPLYAGAFLKGVRDLSIEQMGVYTLIVMTCYEARGHIRENHRALAGRLRTNPRPIKRIIQELVDMGRIVRVEANGEAYLIDERVARELDRAEARIAKKQKGPFIDFKGKNQEVSGIPNFNHCEKSGGFGNDSGIIRETRQKFLLETVPIKETKNKKGARTSAHPPTRTRGETEAFTLDAMASDCQTPEQRRAVELIRERLIDIFDRTIVIERGWPTSHIDSKLGTILKAHGVAIAEDGSREASKAMQLWKSAVGSGG
ncbi:MAG: DUF1376 domain-containing protein [Pseudomonadota bacterium]